MLPLKRVVQEEWTAVRPYVVTGSRTVVIVDDYFRLNWWCSVVMFGATVGVATIRGEIEMEAVLV
jgi:hypothetical protein